MFDDYLSVTRGQRPVHLRTIPLRPQRPQGRNVSTEWADFVFAKRATPTRPDEDEPLREAKASLEKKAVTLF
jgi:hypothetical protein